MAKMVYLIFIFICGVTSYLVAQPPPTENQVSFLSQFNEFSQNTPIQKFDAITKYVKDNCNITIPSPLPKLDYTNVQSFPLYFCIGLLNTVQRVGSHYNQTNFKNRVDAFFNHATSKILVDLRNISSDICSNFDQVVTQDKRLPVIQELRHKLKDSAVCITYCVNDKGVAEQCLYIYGLHKIIYLENQKRRDEEIEKLGFKGRGTPVADISQPEEESIDSINLKYAVSEKANKPPIKISEKPSIVQPTHQVSLNDDLKELSEDQEIGVEDTDRYQTPTVSSTTKKTGVKDAVVTNKKMPENNEKTIISDTVQKADVVAEKGKPKPPLQPQETDFNNDDEGNLVPDLDGDDADDDDLDKGDGDVAEQKYEFNKQVPIEVSSKRISQFGKKPSVGEDVDAEVSLMPWYLMVVFCAFLVYLSFANKKKIVAYVVEGRPNGRYGRRSGRPNTANYRKLDSNLEEAITSNCSTTTSHVIY